MWPYSQAFKLAIVGGGTCRCGLTLRPSNWPLWEEVGVVLLSGLQTGHCGRRYNQLVCDSQKTTRQFWGVWRGDYYE